jgi:thiol-disulfide isomerase/thioredoxin
MLALLASLVGCGPDAGEPAPPPVARADAALVGAPAREFVDVTWLDGQPHTLAELRGRVVLVRFWTDTCPYCKRTAPALRQLDEEFADRGLVVIGLHHPKPRGSRRTPTEVEATARAWDLNFLIGLDGGWATLDDWWLADHPREATSASFLIDRRGIVRLVHPGPEYTPTGDPGSRRDYAEIRAMIEALLAEPP